MVRAPRVADADRQHWILVTDDAVHQPQRGNHGYHVVAFYERGVRLDWNRGFDTEYFSTPPLRYEDVPGIVLEGPRAFHHPKPFWRLRSLRTDKELFALNPWFHPGS